MQIRTRSPRRWTLTTLTACGLTGALLLAGPGCADLQATQAFRADALALRETLDARAAQWQEAMDTLPKGDPMRPALEAGQRQAQAAVVTLDEGITRLDAVLAETVKPTDPITETVGAASPLLPMSLRGPLLLGAAALVTGLRAWRLKAGLASVARGLSVALREDEEFRACFQRHADTFRSTQTPTAKRVVDEVTAHHPPLALPI
ncbi:MAG: hypothetical protein IT431_03920 [Phycisphaerales bacterium]|nr:hypothetical protein [Phycisphaerales bacterium]